MNQYFSHKSFKSFFKRIRSLRLKVRIFYEVCNSIGLPAYIIDETEKLKSLTHEFWKDNAMHHYIINEHIDIEIPMDAHRLSNKDFWGVEWTFSGPRNYFIVAPKNYKFRWEL